jgi:hypothetical protein
MLFNRTNQEHHNMAVKCPQCKSKRINTYNYAKRTCAAIGTLAGAVAGAASCIAGAEIGAAAGIIGGPAGIAIGGIAGAIIGGLCGGAAGCAAGVALGEVVDDNILDNYYCLDCKYTFSKKCRSLDIDSSDSDSSAHQPDRLFGLGRERSYPGGTAPLLPGSIW